MPENIESLRKDAARYRYLRQFMELLVCNEETEHEYVEIIFGETGLTDILGKFNSVDAALDADMATAAFDWCADNGVTLEIVKDSWGWVSGRRAADGFESKADAAKNAMQVLSEAWGQSIA